MLPLNDTGTVPASGGALTKRIPQEALNMSMIRRMLALLLCIAVFFTIPAFAETAHETIPGWAEDSPAMASIIAFVDAASDVSSPDYIAPADRIAVFDFDGTLYGERFPTYFDTCLFLHRVLHDETCESPEEVLYVHFLLAA